MNRTYAWLLTLLLAMAFGFSLGWVMGNNHGTDAAFRHDSPIWHDLKAKGWAHRRWSLGQRMKIGRLGE